MNGSDKRTIINELASAVGFDAVGVAPARRVDRDAYYRRWLADGQQGTMAYLDRYRAQRADASVLLSGARCVIVTALNYHQPADSTADSRDEPQGRVAMYARGKDYHRTIKRMLFTLVEQLRDRIDEPFDAKVCVDTAPIVEREYAMLSGVGWIGKNTLVLSPQLGSYFFLGEIVTTLSLDIDPPQTDHCGSCRRCLDACPTDAFVAPYQMDASRCISYLTIEHRANDIDANLERGMGDWVFGCDVCQQVCPFNQDAPLATEPDFQKGSLSQWPSLKQLAAADDAAIRRLVKGTAMDRAKPDMLRRNARIALRNISESFSD